MARRENTLFSAVEVEDNGERGRTLREIVDHFHHDGNRGGIIGRTRAAEGRIVVSGDKKGRVVFVARCGHTDKDIGDVV